MIKFKFDLFKLDEPKLDISPKSWICFKGKNLREIFMGLIDKITKEKSITKKELCKFISKKLNCSLGPLGEIVYCKKEWIPIPIIKLIFSLIKNKKTYKIKIIHATEFIKCNNATSKPIKAIKFLTIPLSKIAGAHAADGNLHTKIGIEIKDRKIEKDLIKFLKKENCKFSIFKTGHHRRIKLRIEGLNILKKLQQFRKEKKIIFWVSHGLNIAEMYKIPMQAYQNWIFSSFGIKLKLKRYSKQDAYRLDIDNKIIARYLTKFFNFPLGEKTYTVKEPRIIQNSPIKFRRAFLSAYMTFEGHVSNHRNIIEVSSKSYNLIKNIHEIITNLQIPMKELKLDNYNRWICISKSLNKENLKKALSVFEENTEKWNKLYNKIENVRL